MSSSRHELIWYSVWTDYDNKPQTTLKVKASKHANTRNNLKGKVRSLLLKQQLDCTLSTKHYYPIITFLGAQEQGAAGGKEVAAGRY